MSSFLAVDRRAWHSLFAAQIGWMLDAMDFLLFSFAVVPIAIEFHLSKASMGALTSVALIAGGIGGIAFGRLADRIGRVRALMFSILLYSLATAGLGGNKEPSLQRIFDLYQIPDQTGTADPSVTAFTTPPGTPMSTITRTATTITTTSSCPSAATRTCTCTMSWSMPTELDP